MTAELHIADGLSLPIDYVTKTGAILAQRRKGKTYTAGVIAEELVKLEQPWVALDPTGAWWGMRAGADGDEAGGLPVVILGGAHGDAPLEPGSGRFVAELVVDQPGWYVLDLSLLDTRSAERQWATDFAEALIRAKRRPGCDFPLHLFVDEADMFTPQEREGGGDVRMLGAFQAIVRRGGLAGLGTTLISQRPALLNKSVLTQLDILVLLRLVAGQDQDAVNKSYVSRAGSKEQAAELMGSLASLRLGEAWVWEPGAEPPIFQRVQIRQRRTFNSSATPKPGETRVEPRGLADVDLDAVKVAMEQAIERARADDPKELRRQVVELERALRQAHEATEQAARSAVPEIVDRRVEVIPAEALDAVRTMAGYLQHAVGCTATLLEAMEGYEQPQGLVRQEATAPPTAPVVPLRAVPAPSVPADRPAATQGTGFTLAERRILQILGATPGGARPRVQLATLTNYHQRAKAFTNALSSLRSRGLIGSGDPVVITQPGWETANGLPAEDIPQGAQLLAYWKGQPKVGKAAGLILDVLHSAWPSSVEREELAAACSYHPRAKAFTNGLSQLRGLGLVNKAGDALTPEFGEATR